MSQGNQNSWGGGMILWLLVMCCSNSKQSSFHIQVAVMLVIKCIIYISYKSALLQYVEASNHSTMFFFLRFKKDIKFISVIL